MSSFQSLHPNLVVLQNKSLVHLFTKIRDRTSGSQDFEFFATRLMNLLAEETLAEISTTPVTVETPCSVPFAGTTYDPRSIVLVSIIRAGDSLLESFRKLLPGSSVGKILIQRDESKADKPAVQTYFKCPVDIGAPGKTVVICDPMLASGGSCIRAIQSLVEVGVAPERIIFANVICCPEGLRKMAEVFPQVKIVTAAIDDGLNKDKFIVPGLGDYGDRFFNTCH